MNRCSEIRQVLSRSLDGALTPEERTTVDTHLRECAICVDWFAESKASTDLLRGFPRMQLPEDFAEVALLRARRERNEARVLRLRAIAGIAAAVLIIAGAFFLFGGSAPKQPDPELTRIAGEYLNASELFVDQASKLKGSDPTTELAVMEAELQATELQTLTLELIQHADGLPKADQVKKHAEHMRALIGYIQSKPPSEPGTILRVRQLAEKVKHGKEIFETSQIVQRPLSRIGSVDADPSVATYIRGRLHLYQGNYGFARQAFKQFAEAESELSGLAAYCFGEASLRSGHYDEAVPALIYAAQRQHDVTILHRLQDAAKKIEVFVEGTPADRADHDKIRFLVSNKDISLVRCEKQGKSWYYIKKASTEELLKQLQKKVPTGAIRQERHFQFPSINLDLDGVDTDSVEFRFMWKSPNEK